jgi:hypothetical protein
LRLFFDPIHVPQCKGKRPAEPTACPFFSESVAGMAH